MIRFSKRRGGRPGLFWPPAPPPKPKPKQPQRPTRRRQRARLGNPEETTSSVAVRTLQEELHRAGYDTGRIDGRWGPLTQGAIERFWRSTGLNLDLAASADPVLQRVSIATVLWNRLVATPDGAGGETSGSGSRSGNTPRTTTSTRTSSATSSIGNSTTERPAEAEGESTWWQSPWLWGGVALAAGAGVVLLATKDNDEGGSEDEEGFEDELDPLPAF